MVKGSFLEDHHHGFYYNATLSATPTRIFWTLKTRRCLCHVCDRRVARTLSLSRPPPVAHGRAHSQPTVIPPSTCACPCPWSACACVSSCSSSFTSAWHRTPRTFGLTLDRSRPCSRTRSDNCFHPSPIKVSPPWTVGPGWPPCRI